MRTSTVGKKLPILLCDSMAKLALGNPCRVRQSSNNRKYDSDPQVAIAYFYFSFNDGQKQSVNGMMEGQRPDLETLQKVLLMIIPGFSAAYVIIDALDECPDLAGDREKLLKCLNLIHQKDLKNIHLFLTSRREEDIETSYRLIEGDSERTDIDLMTYKPAVDHDIGLLIDSRGEERLDLEVRRHVPVHSMPVRSTSAA
ncbi:hypothetical protein WAI453_000075 [Rhynchosporium graminicola]